jgi:hypothetical protein
MILMVAGRCGFHLTQILVFAQHVTWVTAATSPKKKTATAAKTITPYRRTMSAPIIELLVETPMYQIIIDELVPGNRQVRNYIVENDLVGDNWRDPFTPPYTQLDLYQLDILHDYIGLGPEWRRSDRRREIAAGFPHGLPRGKHRAQYRTQSWRRMAGRRTSKPKHFWGKRRKALMFFRDYK